MPTSWTQADIDKLESVIGSGVLTVTYDGPPRRSITYQSTQAMQLALAMMRRAVGGSPTHRFASTSKGFKGGGGGTGGTPWSNNE